MRPHLQWIGLTTATLVLALTVPLLPVFAQTAQTPQKAEADRLLKEGNAQREAGKNEAALPLLQQALKLYQELSDRAGVAQALHSLGTVYLNLQQYEKALAYYQQALPIYQQLKDRNGEAIALNSLGNGYQSLSQYEKAISYYQQALSIFQQLHDRNGEASALGNLGHGYQSLSQYEKAISYYQQALPIFQQLHDRNGEANVLNSLGSAYHSLSQYEKAISYHQQALPIFQQVHDRDGRAGALMNLGLAYYSLSQYEKAISYYQQALPIFQQLHDRNGEATVLGNLAIAYKSLSQYEKAISYYQQVLTIFQQLQNRDGEAKVLMNLGNAYLSLSQYEKAISYYQQALPIFQQVHNRDGEAYALKNLGNGYHSLSQYENALGYFQQALPIFQQVHDRESEGKALSTIGDLFKQQHQPDLAIIFYKQSVNVREIIRTGIRQLPRDSQEAYTQSVAGTYRALADLLISQGRIGEAQQVLERLKIQELNDFTKGTRAPTAIGEVSFNPVETQITDKYTSLIAFGGKFYECEQQRCSQYSELKTQYQNLSKEFQAFVEQIKQQLHDSRLTQVDRSTQDFQTSAERVVTANPNSILIYPLVLADKTRLLWAAKGGVLSKTAVCPLGEKALYNKVSQFQTLLSTRGDETQLKALGKDLYDCLVKPIEPELAANPIQHLIFVPDRATNYIPMGALFDGKQYLIQRFTVSNILSANLTDTESTLPSPQSTPVLALGLSEAKGNYSALPSVEAEVNAIVKQTNNSGIYPGEILLNQQFTKDAFEDNIRGHKIIHIATHGEFKPENPRSSYFLLGTGTPYPIPDVQTLRDLKDVQLVVLSACQTGLGGTDGLGLEVSGISSFFLGDRDRAKAVMASLWDVNDASTSLLMQQFYKHLATGKMTKAEALRQAQLSLLDGKLTAKDAKALDRAGSRRYIEGQAPVDSLAHPYYWAPFILIGNSR